MLENLGVSTLSSVAVIGGAVIVVGGGMAYAMTHGKLPLPDFLKMSINDLVRDQIIDDEFDGGSLLNWIKENRTTEEIKVLVVKPTKFWLKKLNLKSADKIDAEKNLIGCMIDSEGKLLSMQLFTFSTISQTMQKKFNAEGEMILTS